MSVAGHHVTFDDVGVEQPPSPPPPLLAGVRARSPLRWAAGSLTVSCSPNRPRPARCAWLSSSARHQVIST